MSGRSTSKFEGKVVRVMAMNINDSFRYMQDYRINNIPRVDVQAPVEEKPEVKPQVEEKQTPAISIEPVVDNRPRNVNLDDVSMTFNRQDNFGYIGKDRDVSLLDMEKAINMMRQDSALQDYQYFVGNSRDIFSSEDGRVIPKF